MIRISNIKMEVGHNKKELKQRAAKMLKVKPDAFTAFEIRKQSVDARKKPVLYYVYTVDVEIPGRKTDTGKKPVPSGISGEEGGISVCGAGNGNRRRPDCDHRQRTGRAVLRLPACQAWLSPLDTGKGSRCGIPGSAMWSPFGRPVN